MSPLYGSVPANVTTRWHPEPEFRGTYSILSSCLITMGLASQWEKEVVDSSIWPQIKWLLIGLFAPEVIAWVAFEQRKQAARIGENMNAAFSQPQDNPNTESLANTHTESTIAPARNWSITHSYFTLMGGFGIQVQDINFMVSKRHTRLTLTPHGLEFVAKHAPHLIPEIPEGALRDKSKANGLAKTLVCLQATWFCIQCITRLSQALTISLLELNTFAHAVCTLVIYFLWWDKLLDVEEPTVLQDEGLREMCTLLVVSECSRSFWRQLQDPDKPIRYVLVSKSDGSLMDREYFADQVEERSDNVCRVRRIILSGHSVSGRTVLRESGETLYHADLTRSEFDQIQLAVSEMERIGL
ncbi:hypothetical protein BDV96DRAFT_598786 [Lophiotrema nucula]|uniref:Uncharacterized protein n=1 Tax=Lophiotrema nucula TaxID=690887 RepID=A0A6A5ZF27_9PLEO|nr:hypothetical protein BDV96DRAFT_598786 [Lophiotrema nucula]